MISVRRSALWPTLVGIWWCSLVAVAFSSLWDPFPAVSWWAWLALAGAATLGAGLTARTLWVAAAAPAPIVAAGLLDWTARQGSSADAASLVPLVATVLAAALLATGALIARRVPRGSLALGAVLLAAPLAPIAWATALRVHPVDARPAHPVRIDLATGAVGSLQLGARTARVEAVIGTPIGPTPARVTGCGPAGALEGTSSTAAALFACRHTTAVLVLHGQLVTIATSDPRAQTPRGVGVGDDIRIARRRYPGLACARDDTGNPECLGITPGGVVVIFHGDPIDGVVVSRLRLGLCGRPGPTCPHIDL